MDARRKRARLLDSRMVGGPAAALGRRTGRGAPAPKMVAEYFGTDEDTPVLEMLKAVRPDTRMFRGGEHIHVSDVISKCVRKIAIMRRMNMRHPQESLMDGHAITYAIGDSLHDYVKAKFRKGHPDKVWAHWLCPCGKTGHVGTFSARPETVCKHCKLPVDRHNEVAFVDEEFKLSGSPDLLLWLDQYGALYVIEIKSMAAEMWKELVRPLPDHLIQIALYWHIIKKTKMPVVDRTSILYVNKEFSFKFPYKEFMVDPAQIDVQNYLDDLEALKVAGDGGDLPPRVLCGTQEAPEAKKCPVCVTCFGCK